MEVAARTADVVNEASGPPAPLPGLLELMVAMLLTPATVLIEPVEGGEETACRRPANIPNGCGAGG